MHQIEPLKLFLKFPSWCRKFLTSAILTVSHISHMWLCHALKSVMEKSTSISEHKQAWGEFVHRRWVPNSSYFYCVPKHAFHLVLQYLDNPVVMTHFLEAWTVRLQPGTCREQQLWIKEQTSLHPSKNVLPLLAPLGESEDLTDILHSLFLENTPDPPFRNTQFHSLQVV